MVFQLFTTFKSSRAIALILLLASETQCLASEYIFTAPPEVGQELIEIPSRETEYPLYECDIETETDSEAIIDAHECDCVDCEEITQESTPEEKISSKNKQNRIINHGAID